MTFGNKIKSRREELGLTQSELAQRARLTQGYISILENEDYIPKSTTILVLALALEMPYTELLSYTEERSVV